MCINLEDGKEDEPSPVQPSKRTHTAATASAASSSSTQANPNVIASPAEAAEQSDIQKKATQAGCRRRASGDTRQEAPQEDARSHR